MVTPGPDMFVTKYISEKIGAFYGNGEYEITTRMLKEAAFDEYTVLNGALHQHTIRTFVQSFTLNIWISACIVHEQVNPNVHISEAAYQPVDPRTCSDKAAEQSGFTKEEIMETI